MNSPGSSPDVVVLGAGAAGLLCAITAARRGRRVLVLEKSNKPGKKILMSGGGRCNFTNTQVSTQARPAHFLSANPHFFKSALSRYTPWHFIEMVEQHGIEYFEKETVNGPSGALFCQGSSKEIVAMLLAECSKSGVEVQLNCETRSVQNEAGFQLDTPAGPVSAETLVVATGGLSIPSLGGSGFGYELAEQFGLRTLPTRAGLVPFTFSDQLKDVFSGLSGVSCPVRIHCGQTAFREELLFTHRGLSGPAVLQISSFWKPGDAIRLDLLPDDDAETLLHGWKQQHPRSLLRTLLSQKLPQKLVVELEDLWWVDASERPLAEWPDRRLAELGGMLNDWSVKPSGTEGYRTAEVTMGGVDTRDLSSKTMESNVSGLFFIGEAVDVTGQLGGFNFQWAWASGYVAGEAL